MKNLSILSLSASVLVLAALSTTVHAADSATENYTLGATVNNTCNIPTPAGADSNITFDVVDTTDATVNAGSGGDTRSNVMCNYAALVSVQTTNGGLTQATGGSSAISGSTFLDRIDYTAAVTYCGQTATITTDGETTGATALASETCTGANIGDLALVLSTTEGTTPVLQGSYSDTLTVQVGAAL